MRVLIVKNPDENPLTVLRTEAVHEVGQNLEEIVGAIVRRYNDRAVVKAAGTLAWTSDSEPRSIEFRAKP
jgi:hypothetical protein